MKKISLILITLVACCLSCDKIEGPYVTSSGREAISTEFPDLNTSEIYRKVLLEEYTGHRCTNCPAAHQRLEELHDLFGDTLVIVGIHATALAATTNRFPYDFRIDGGTQLANDFGINSVPAGIINRQSHTGGWGKDEWQTQIQAVDRSKVYAAIQIVNQYDYPTEGNLKVNVQVTMLESYDESLNFSLFLVEDSIVKPQLNGDEIVDDYTHNHVLRACINGTYGGLLTETGVLEKDNTYTYGYSVNFTDKDWVPENCYVVAILFDKTNGDVLQVEKVSVQ